MREIAGDHRGTVFLIESNLPIGVVGIDWREPLTPNTATGSASSSGAGFWH